MINILILLKYSNGQFVLKNGFPILKKLSSNRLHCIMGEMGEMSRVIKKNDSVKYHQRKYIFLPVIFSFHFSLTFKCHLCSQII